MTNEEVLKSTERIMREKHSVVMYRQNNEKLNYKRELEDMRV